MLLCVCIGERFERVSLKYYRGWKTLRKLSEKLKAAGIMIKGFTNFLGFFRSASSKGRGAAS